MIAALRGWLAAGALALLLAGGWAIYAKGARDGRAEVRAEWSAARVAAAETARKQEAVNRAETERRYAVQQEIVNETRHQLDQALRDADAARDAGERLRTEINRVRAARCPAGHPALASGGAPAEPAADLLADVQQRLDDAADVIARYADAAAIAGRACERSYDALTR